MDRFKLKGILLLAVLILGLIFAAPTFFGKHDVPDGWIGPKAKVRLGLDLQGGMHLVLKVDSLKAVESRLNSVASDIRGQLIRERIRYGKIAPEAPDFLIVELRRNEDFDKLSEIVRTMYPYLVEVSTSSSQETFGVRYRMSSDEAERIRDQAVAQALETIRNRIDQFGVTEPSIIPEGKERIVLQLPGITDPERAKNLIGRTAILEFKLVDEKHSVEDALKGDIPPGSSIAYMRDARRPILLKD
ncbi:MAG: protein translocase subunit SecD, partial [Desulfomonilia bacterium]|nr:protein translocase subunit SecD [Desulfomonilia bacterium]